MKSPKRPVRVAIIDNSIDNTVYRPVDHWKRWLSAPCASFRAKYNQLPDLLAGFTHLILTGSEASILEREEWVDKEISLVQDALGGGLSILGSCYGHQLLALALKGPISVRRCASPEVGWIRVEIPESNILLGNQGNFFTFSSHFDEVVNLGPDFRVIASTRDCPVQGFELIGKSVWGLQCHPEINAGDAKDYMNAIIGLNLETRAHFTAAMMEKPRDSGFIRGIVSRFLANGGGT